MGRTIRYILMLLVLALFAQACPSWSPEKTGQCNPGRTWVPPVEQNGEWQPGYCKDIQ